jgi:hypothetical protein
LIHNAECNGWFGSMSTGCDFERAKKSGGKAAGPASHSCCDFPDFPGPFSISIRALSRFAEKQLAEREALSRVVDFSVISHLSISFN